NNLAGRWKQQGRHEEAGSAYAEALAIYEETLGSEHPNVAQTLGNLATVRSSQGRYDEARVLHARERAIKERALGPRSPSVAVSLLNMGFLEQRARDFARAEE